MREGYFYETLDGQSRTRKRSQSGTREKKRAQDDEVDKAMVDEQQKLAEKFAMGGFMILVFSVSCMAVIAYLAHHGDNELETIRRPMRTAGNAVYEQYQIYKGNATLPAATAP